MTETPSDQFVLMNQAIQLSTVDREFRQRLLAAPVATLQELGLDLNGMEITVREFDPNEWLIILPPFLEEESPPSRPDEARAEGDPSPPMRGLTEVALLNPTDDRAIIGLPPTEGATDG
jgi:hypothetical protein